MSYLYAGTLRDWQGNALREASITIYTDSAGSTAATGLTDLDGTAITNPVTTDDRGRIAANGKDGIRHASAVLWYKAAGDSRVMRLLRFCDFVQASISGLPFISVMDYGATGNGSTDDTDAVQDALDAAVSTPAVLYFPAGDFLVTGLTLDNVTEGIHIVGAGSKVTRILTTGATPIFSLGTYDSTPSSPWVGTVAGFKLSGVTLANSGYATIAHVAAADQTSIGIQDNGSGKVTLRDVYFSGLKYGVYAPYGHDFSRYYDVDFFCCGTSMYFGPGSQQIYIYGGSSSLHGRGLVIEGSRSGAMSGFTFTEPHTRDIEIRCPDTLESGVTGLTTQTASEMTWTFGDCWFETGSGWSTGWGPTEHVKLGNAADTYGVRGVLFRRIHLVSGDAGQAAKDPGTVYAFVNADFANRCKVDDILIEGGYIDAIVTHPGTGYPPLHVHNAKTVDGYTEIPSFDPTNYACIDSSEWLADATGLAVAGSRDGNAALADLITQLARLGLITDSTTAS